jgi:hypothetical protein
VIEGAGLGLLLTSCSARFMARATGGHEPARRRSRRCARCCRRSWASCRGAGRRALYTFPSAVLLMTFLSFFIGTFLQLLWEDLPITEPL